MNREALLAMAHRLGDVKQCIICFEDIPHGMWSSGFACEKPHYFHPACIFKTLVASGKAPTCPVCSAGPHVHVSTLTPFQSMIAIPRESPPESWKDFYLQDQDYLLADKDTREEPPGFLVAGPYPFTKQDFGHWSNTTTHGSNKDMDYYPLAVWRYLPKEKFGRKVIGYGTLVYFQGRAYRINTDGSIRGPLTEPRDEEDGSITIIRQ